MANKNLFNYIAISIIIVLGFSVYANSIDGKFVWDDIFLISENVYIRNVEFLPKLFTKNINAGAGYDGSFYRPVLMLSFMPDYFFWKLDVRGYHITTIIYHILAALCFYWFANIISGDKLLSFLAGVLFVTHPVMAEDVAYITGRADSMCLVFLLLSVIFYIKFLNSKSLIKYMFSLGFFVLSFMSKESGIILPALLLGYHFVLKRKIRLKPFIPLAIICSIYVVFRLCFFKAAPIDPAHFSYIYKRIPGFFVALVNYVRLIFLPYNLHSGYGQRFFPAADPKAIFGIIIFVFSLLFVMRRKERFILASFSVVWFYVTIFPVSNVIYPASEFMAERYLYIPSIGIFLIASEIISSFYRDKRFRTVTVCFVTGVIALNSFLTVRHNSYWSEPIPFYEKRIKTDPEQWDVYLNLGRQYGYVGRYKEAMDCYNKAIRLKPHAAMPYNNLGCIYNDIVKNHTRAIELFNIAIGLYPNHAKPYYNLGVAYHRLGEKDNAIEAYKKSIELYPEYIKAHHNISVLYYEKEKYSLAIRHSDIVTRFDRIVDQSYREALNAHRENSEDSESE